MIALPLILAGCLAAQEPDGPAATSPVVGQVVDARGDPVPAAEVWLSPADDPGTVLARGHTDGEGRYQLPAAAAGLLKVHATAPGKLQGHAWIGPHAWLQTHLVTLWDGVTVRGRVTDAGGRAVAGTAIAVGPARDMVLAIDVVEARSDAEGNYVLEHAPNGEVWLSAWAPGKSVVARRGWLGRGAAEDFAFGNEQPRGITVTVRGLPEGTSPAGWQVALSRSSGPERALPGALHRGALDGAGRWQVLGLPVDQAFHIGVTDPAGAWSCERAVWSSRSAVRFELAVAPAESVTWTVTLTDPRDEPLAGQKLRLGLAGRQRIATTSASGEASITAPCGRSRWCSAVLVQSPRWVLSASEYEHAPEPGPRHASDRAGPVRLRAVPAALVQGRLVDDQQRPLVVDVILEEWMETRLPKWVAMAHSRTDRDGRFVMTGLFPYERPLRLRVPAACALLSVDALVSGETQDLGDVVVEPAGRVEGVVRGASGRPIPGARVFLIQMPPAAFDQAELLADAEGRFTLAPAAPGLWLPRLHWADKKGLEVVGSHFEVRQGRTVTLEVQSVRD